MKVKRILSLLLAAVLTAGLWIVPASAAEDSAPFRDISDPETAEAAEVLRLLGVVSGTGSGVFSPGRILSRAEFCKMTVEVMDRGAQEPGQRSRTIFRDVGPGHWARGYINLASTITLGGGSTGGEGGEASGGTRLIMGVGNGSFEPDRPITCGEAVTILMRVLGYGNSDVSSGANWYDGYMALAGESGLTEDLSLDASGAVSRGQAARLFYNLLFTKPKDSGEIYLTTLGGKKTDAGIILDVDAQAADGSGGAVKTTTGTYKTERAPLSAEVEGLQGELVLDKDGKLLAFLPKENLTRRSLNVSEWAYNHVVDTTGAKLDIPPESVIYMDGEEKVYKDLWQDMKGHRPLTIYYTTAGKVDYLFFRTGGTAETALVAKNRPSGTTNPFGALVSRITDYQIYKNGVPATVADIRQYDAATYDAATKILHVSDLKLTGVYENVSPNRATPAKLKMLGVEFDVLPSAAADLQSFRLGDTITLLLTVDGQVAGVVDPDTARSNTVGVVTEISGGTATVEPLNEALSRFKFSGKTTYTGTKGEEIEGQLVTVSSTSVGRINLSRLSGSGARAPLDVAAGAIGGVRLAPNVVIYERVGTSKPKKVELNDITCNQVAADRIPYVSRDYAGRISVMVLNDVTGDGYTYGHIRYTDAVPGAGMDAGQNATVAVENGRSPAGPVDCGVHFQNNALMGIAITSNGKKLAGYTELLSIQGVSRASFDVENQLVTLPNMVIPIADEVLCYNRTTKTWFSTAETDPKDALNEARAFADTLTIYYDKAPEDGGKVRIVVVS